MKKILLLLLLGLSLSVYAERQRVDVAVGTETDPQVNTLTGSKWCVSNAGGTAIDCTENAPAGSGDVTDVGDCASGACFTGTTGNTLTFKGATSGTTALKPSAVAGTTTVTLPAETGTVCTTASVCSGYQGSGTYVTSVTGTSPIASSGGTTPAISIANAVADGATKGAASFTAADFDAAAGNISIDYTNAQAASGTLKGFLASADWTTFNNKQSALSNSAGLAAALSDETGSGLAVFGTSPVFTTSIAIPQGTAPTVDAAGEIAVDTTDDQLLFYGGALRVIPYTYEKCFTIESIAAADDNVPIWSPVDAVTVTGIYCRVQGGTSAGVTISDGTNAMEEVVCSTTGQADDGTLVNNTFTANERVEFDTGTVTGTVTWTNVCLKYVYDRQ